MIRNWLGLLGPRNTTFRKIARQFLHRDGMWFYPNFVDSSQVFTDYYFGRDRVRLYQYLAGENFYYLGSDGSHFFTASFPWHRDWFTALPLLKFNSYFFKYPFLGGRFLIIPGSNRTCDSYAQMLQKSMAWPMQNQRPGGMSENEFLPSITNPRGGMKARMKGFFERMRHSTLSSVPVPHVALRVRSRDLLVFDHRSIHCVESNFPPFSRRLLTILLAKNPYDFPSDHYLFEHGHTREELLGEVVDLVVNERNHISIPPYGDRLLSHGFSRSKHFMRIDKVANGSTLQHNRGSVELPDGTIFSSTIDEMQYGRLGAEYRSRNSTRVTGSSDPSSRAYEYADIHLGLNAQRIRDLKTE